MADVVAAATPTTGGASSEGSSAPQSTTPAPDKAPDTPLKDGLEAKEAAPAPEPRTYKRKINGKEEVLNADEVDKAAKLLGLYPADLLQGSQLKRAAYEKFEAARKIEQQFAKYKDQDPWAIAKEIKGLKDEDLDSLAEDILEDVGESDRDAREAAAEDASDARRDR